MKIVRSDELDTLAETINNSFLEECLKCNDIKFTWKCISNSPYSNIDNFKYWLKTTLSYSENENICYVITANKLYDNTFYYTFAVADATKLHCIISKRIKLKTFI